MQLVALQLAFRIFDPRRWRQRLRQLGWFVGAVTWIWFRAVQRAEVVRAVADARHIERDARIDARTAELEAERLTA